MKILKLNFKNLNSLYGEHSIDFSSPDYAANGIFVLSGPTGSGKSTILDAICLALYGSTPRLDKITESKNEIMSKQAGDCYAELTFASQSGVFRCYWSQKRAGTKPSGKLQAPEHELVNAQTNELLETKRSMIVPLVKAKTGMDFNSFTLSIILPQGAFAEFLNAKSGDKATILEQITGSDIYTKISQKVFERQREEQAKLDTLREKLRATAVLSQEEESKISSKQRELEEQKQDLLARQEKNEAAQFWLDSLAARTKELAEINAAESQLRLDLNKFSPARERLKRGREVLRLREETAYNILLEQRKKQEAERKARPELEGKLAALKTALAAQQQRLEHARNNLSTKKEEQKTQIRIFEQVRNLDQKLRQEEASLAEETEAAKELENKLAELQDEEKNGAAQLGEIVAELQAASKYLETNKLDEQLTSEFTGIEVQLKQLVELQSSFRAQEESLKLGKEDLLLGAASKTKHIRSQLAHKRADRAKKLAQRSLSEYRQELALLIENQILLNKIESLEEERAQLRDGQACPLCGAATHPYAAGNTPQASENQQRIDTIAPLISTVEQLNEDIQSLELQEQMLEQLSSLERQLSALKLAIIEKLTGFGIGELPANLADLQSSLATRRQNWEEQEALRTKIGKEERDQQNKLQEVANKIKEKMSELGKKREALASKYQELQGQKRERQELFANKDPKLEEQRLSAVLEHIEAEQQERLAEQDEIKASLIKTEANSEALNKSIAARAADLQRRESDFSTVLRSSPFFTDESDFRKSMLPDQELSLLAKQADQLDREAIRIRSHKEERQRALQEIQKKALTARTKEELKKLLGEIKNELAEIGEELTKSKLHLASNAQAKEQQQQVQEQIEKQGIDCANWNVLNGAIGSSDGKKYKNFAQGLTFATLINFANQHLVQMSERYLLEHDKADPKNHLELNVIDNYQAAEKRAVRTLSGGESFIVSLALALGLSKMTSKKVRVDSLFLDEGFGTLDEAALETALDALGSLQQDTKLIGIISHVEALKERISTQINVIPQNNGKSIIVGPGCESKYKRTRKQLDFAL